MLHQNLVNGNLASGNMILAGIKEEEDMNVENERLGGGIHTIDNGNTTGFQNKLDSYEGQSMSALQSTQDKVKQSKRDGKSVD